MGFHVTLEANDDRLIRAIRQSPAEVFGRSYAGYFLFLVGSADRTALDWLREHLVSLDSLTGQHFAFGVFAEKVQVSLHIPGNYGGAERRPRFLEAVPLTDVRRIDSYIKSQRLGMVTDGDQLIAMTYGTDRVAKAFGVLEHLPCVLLLDAFPTEKVEVVEMTDAHLPELLGVLRFTVSRMMKSPEFPGFYRSLLTLSDIQQEHDTIVGQIREQKRLLSHVPVEADVADRVKTMYTNVVEHLKLGDYRRLRDDLGAIREYVPAKSDLPLDEQTGRMFVGYGKTLRALTSLESKAWPLGEKDQLVLDDLVSRHIRRLLPNVAIPDDIDQRALADLKSTLLNRQISITSAVIATLPNEREVSQAAVLAFGKCRETIEHKLQDLGAQMDRIQNRGREALEQCLSDGAPSLQNENELANGGTSRRF